MPSNVYYPKLSQIISLENLPEPISKIDGLVDALFDDLYYNDYQFSKSRLGDAAFYRLELVILKKLGLDIPGAEGMQLLLNPNLSEGGGNSTIIPITVSYRWEILKYIKGLKADNYSGDPASIFNVVRKIIDIKPKDLIEGTINIFIDEVNPQQKFVDEYNLSRSPTTPLTLNLGFGSNVYSDLANQIKNNNDTAFAAIFEGYIVDGSLNETLQKMKDLFNFWVDNIDFDDILKKILIPRASVSVEAITLALLFPRKIFQPLDAFDEIIPDENVKSSLTFDVGSLVFNTETGFHFNGEGNFHFQKSMILNSGFTLEIKNMKLDLSRNTNIPEAIADGRPVEFIGMYCKDATVGLPKKWFKQKDNQTLAIYSRNLLVGTGGLSGNIGLEVIGTGEKPTDKELEFVLGKEKAGQTNRKGFTIAFKSFDMEWYQNSLVQSEVEGSITIPNFKRYNKATKKSETDDLKINIEALFEQNGDFEITAKPEDGLCICIGKDGKVLFIDILSLSVGKDNDKVYLEVAGDLDFSNNNILKKFIKTPISIKKLRIYSDGSFEIEGGSIPIPGSIPLNLGPVQVNVTNITLGSETIKQGEYKFIGFDCGVSSGSGGYDLKGDGIKCYFNADGSHMFVRISGIGIDLTIPATATDETASLIVKGYLSLKESKYTGSVSFDMPKAKIAGGAAMEMQPKVPAFAIDAFMEMSTAIPLGPTGLGIYAFRGLFGLRYTADLPDGALQDPDKMFDFYAEDKPNPLNGNTPAKGLHLGKIVTPEERASGAPSSRTPISIGAGLSLGTTADAGRAFSMQAFLFLSIPEMLMISGKANVLGERVSIVGEEPPFFAYMALTREYISLGMGADYKIPKAEENPDNAGDFLDLHAEAQLAFFFKDPSAWYVNFGTIEEPNRAQLLKKIFNLNAYAYIMLSAAGIQAGAGVRFNKEKKYGPARIAVNAYADVYGMVSFRKVQVGGGIAFGGSLDVSVYGVGFYIGLDAYLMMTVPKPFIISGGVQVCVKLKLAFFKFEKCFNVEFKWEFNRSIDTSPIGILASDYNPAAGHHIGSKLPYNLAAAYTVLPNPNHASHVANFKSVPLDTHIDLQLKKAVSPNAAANIGGLTNAATNNIEKVAPKSVNGQVTHRFMVSKVDLLVYNGTTWESYHPYEALDPTALNSVNPSDLKLGYWQKKGKEYNNLRVLSNSPLAFTDSMSGEIIPEQMGITAATLFCPSKEISRHCIQWNSEKQFSANTWTNHKSILFKVTKKDGNVTSFSNVYQIPHSLSFDNHSTVEIIFPEKVTSCHLKLFNFVKKLEVSYFSWETSKINEEADGQVANSMTVISPEYTLVEKRNLSSSDFIIPVKYENENQPIKKIVIEVPCGSGKEKIELKNTIGKLRQLQLVGLKQDEKDQSIVKELKKYTRKLKSLESECCPEFNSEREIENIIKESAKIEKQLGKIKGQFSKLGPQIKTNCGKLKKLRELLESCFSNQLNCTSDKPCNEIKLVKIKDERYSKYISQIKEIQQSSEKCCKEANAKLRRLRKKLQSDIRRNEVRCEKLTGLLDNLKDEESNLIDQLTGLESQREIIGQYEDIDSCRSYLHEVCYLTEEEVIYNHSIPSRAAVEADYSALVNAHKVIAPILRPNEKYALQVDTLEKVNSTIHTTTKYFPFATDGPLGHFSLAHLSKELRDQYKLDNNGEPLKTDPATNEPISEDYDNAIEIPENNLKFYLDTLRCFPNPSGNILQTKLMYYESPEIQLFFNQPYVKHFFGNWPSYKGLQEKESKLVVVIKDPTESGITNTTPATNENATVLETLPKTNVAWKQDVHFRESKPLSILNDLRNPKRKNVDFNGQTCWQIGGEPIKPYSVKPEIKVENLLPSKLYNVVVFNDYSEDMINYSRAQIHAYPFQTSRYANLASHVGSYHQKNDKGEEKDAIYDALQYKDLNLDSSKNLKILLQMFLGIDEAFPNDIDQKLVTTYPDVYQRAINGYLEIKDISSPQNTEFNILRNDSGTIIAIWLRTLEPLNDPRIPFDILFDSIKVIFDGNEKSMAKRQPGLFESTFKIVDDFIDSVIASPVPFNFVTIFSKDNSCALIIPTSPIVNVQDLKLKFSYLAWNGNDYIEKQTYTTDKLL